MDTILLVNDSTTLTKMLTGHFNKAGYKVIAVSAAMDAYEAFIRNEVHVILTDYFLRDKDGLEVIQTFRSRKRHNSMPIVVFTALEDEQVTQKCKEAGADLVLAKTAGAATLTSAIDKLVDEYKSRMPSASLDQDLGRCIVKATSEVFRTMLNMRVAPGEVKIEKAQLRKSEVIGSIGVAGFLSGTISLFMPKKLARKAVGAMLMMDEGTEPADEELIDAIGELINMVGGGVKTELFEKAPLFDISIPSVYVGEDLQRRAVSDDLCFLVPFTVDDLAFQVEFLMVTKKEGGTGVQSAVVSGMQKA